MARARNIKPGFFTNEDLVELDFATRLLFIGLWTEADREGRLEDRPKRLKMALFPADNLDVDAALGELAVAGFIRRYEVGGKRYIQVLNFGKHQNPHVKEAASIIPAPADDEPAQDKHHASPVLAPCKHSASPADSLIPDSIETPLTPADLRDESASEPIQAATAPTVGPHLMTLDWEPDQRRLPALALRAGLPMTLFAPEAIAGFVIHHEAKGLSKTVGEWHAALVNWVKRDAEQAKAQANRVVSFPGTGQRRANGPDFDDLSWAQDLGEL